MVVRLKTVVVGYGGVGKTCMLIRYARGEFPEVYVPTVFENYLAECQIDGQNYELALWDTGGGEDYPRLRPLSYPDTDVFILLFAVTDGQELFSEIYSYWWRELNHFCPDVPIILVGSKIDLRFNGIKTISTVEGEAMSKKIGAVKYMEISSLRDTGVTELFEEVLRIGRDYNANLRRKRRRGRRKCNIL